MLCQLVYIHLNQKIFKDILEKTIKSNNFRCNNESAAPIFFAFIANPKKCDFTRELKLYLTIKKLAHILNNVGRKWSFFCNRYDT